MRKYRTTPHNSTGYSPMKLLINRVIRLKVSELTKCEFINSEARDRDAEMKQREPSMPINKGEQWKIF